MNTKKNLKKLSLNKTTVTNLIENSMDDVKGGGKTLTYHYATCDPSWCGSVCPWCCTAYVPKKIIYPGRNLKNIWGFE